MTTTASLTRHDYLKELGADVCFDYKDSNVVSQMKQAADDSLAYAFDCISEEGSTKQIRAVRRDQNSQVTTILLVPADEIASHVEERSVVMYTIFGRE